MTRTAVAGALAVAVFATAATPADMWAQGTITVSAGAAPSAQVAPSGKVAVPIIADMSAATGTTNLAALTTTVTWGQARLTLDSVKAGAFGSLTANTSNAASGTAALSLFNGTGTTTTVTVGTLYFTAAIAPGGTQVLLAPTVAGDDVGSNLLPILRTQGLNVCVGPSGLWGDVNGDNAVNIIDAQQIARFSVGLAPRTSAAPGLGAVESPEQELRREIGVLRQERGSQKK